MEIHIHSWCNFSVSVTVIALFVTKRKFCFAPDKFLHRTLECYNRCTWAACLLFRQLLRESCLWKVYSRIIKAVTIRLIHWHNTNLLGFVHILKFYIIFRKAKNCYFFVQKQRAMCAKISECKYCFTNVLYSSFHSQIGNPIFPKMGIILKWLSPTLLCCGLGLDT